MGNRRACLVCRTPFGAEDVFCFKCGAKIDVEVLDEAASIDYLLNEIKEWPNWLTIPTETEKQLIDHYETRIVRITDSIRALPPIVIPPIETIQPPPPALFVETRPQPTDAVVNLSALEAIIADTIASDPPQITFVEPEPTVETKPIVATPIEVVIAPPLMETFIEEEPEAPRKSIAELVAENIKLIFAISAALFVGGILLYYRNEIYHGLKQPITQAIMLGFVTVSSIVAGWTLVRKTHQTLAGRTLTLVGSLLVPINPWFLVRTHLIPESGNGWILGLACTALYGWTAYFLKEKLYVYLALVTGIITGWAAVFQLTNGADTSAYSMVLMAFSIAYLLAENFVRRIADREENANVDFGSPFFHVAQIGMALSLLFYTPLVTFVPFEFVAAKRYFDPEGYSRLTAWLALCAAFGYFYSGLNRRYRIFVYLGITALLCAESSALYNLEVALPTAVLVYVLTALVMMVIARSGRAGNSYAKPLSHVGILASLVMVCWSVVLFTLNIVNYQQPVPSWRLIVSIALGGTILSIDSFARKTSEAIFTAGALFAAAIIFAAFKLEIPQHLIPMMFLVPAYALLIAHKRTPDEDNPYPREHFHSMAVVLTTCIVAGSAFIGENWLAHKLALSALALWIAGIFGVSTRKTTEKNGRIAQSYAVLLFGVISYAAFLSWTGLPAQMALCLGMIYPAALLLAAIMWKKKTRRYLGQIIEEPYTLRSFAVILAVAVTVLSAVSGPFASHEFTRAVLMFELAAFFAVSAFNTEASSAREVQLYASASFGAVSYGTLLDRLGFEIQPSLCLAMIYPFGLLALDIWQKYFGSEHLKDKFKESFVLRSSAIVAALVIIVLSLTAPQFGPTQVIYAFLMLELAVFFAVSGFDTENQINRVIQLCASALFGAFSYATVLNWSGFRIETDLCLGMAYPFAMLGAAAWLKHRRRESSEKLSDVVAVLKLSAVAFAAVIATLSQFGAAQWVFAVLMLELAVFFALSGFEIESQLGRTLQLCGSALFGAFSYATVLKCSNFTIETALCLGMAYPFAMFGAAVWLKNRTREYSQKLSDIGAVLRFSALAFVVFIATLSAASGSFLTGGFIPAILMFELAVFFCASGFESNLQLGRVIQFAASAFFGTLSFRLLLLNLGVPDYLRVPSVTGLAYAMLAGAALIRIAEGANSSAIQSSENATPATVSPVLLAKLIDAKLTLTASSIVVMFYGIACCEAFNLFEGHAFASTILTAEIVGLLCIFGHLTSDRLLSYASFLGACLFAAIFLNNGLMFVGLTSLMQRPFAFALMALSFYLISQQNRVREELRDSLSIASTSIAVCVFFRSILSFVDFHNSQDQTLPLLLIAPLLVIDVKEIIHLVRTRNTFHTIFSLLIGFALVGKFLGIANVEFATVIISIECLSLAYLVSAHFLRQRQVEPEVVVPIEILANIAMAICWILALTSYTPFNLRTCVAITIATVFYAIGALQRKSEFIGRIYAHVASSVSLITVIAFLNHFGLGNVSDASTVLLPLLSIYVLSEYLLKKSVFRESLFNIAQAVFPVVAILQFQDGLKSQSTAIESTVFFAEISVFYLLSSLQKKLSGLIYPGIAALGTAIWFGLHVSNIDNGYITPFYAIFGFGLLLLQKQLSEKQNWSTEAIDNCGHITLALAAIGAVGQSIAHMHLRNAALTPAIVSLLVIIGIVTAISFIEPDSEVKRFYRIAAAALVFITYITFGIRLGYHLTKATEFYSIPMGALLLVAGYIQVRKKRDLAAIWLWIGSGLLAVPLLLHALQYRFIIEQPSTSYDVALLVISLALILGGILEHLKAPTIIGGSSFLIVMSVIVFSYVDWEQKTLSISMIVLALVLFVSSWIIYSFYKRNQLGAISRQGKQVIEEFGKWR